MKRIEHTDIMNEVAVKAGDARDYIHYLVDIIEALETDREMAEREYRGDYGKHHQLLRELGEQHLDMEHKDKFVKTVTDDKMRDLPWYADTKRALVKNIKDKAVAPSATDITIHDTHTFAHIGGELVDNDVHIVVDFMFDEETRDHCPISILGRHFRDETIEMLTHRVAIAYSNWRIEPGWEFLKSYGMEPLKPGIIMNIDKYIEEQYKDK